MAWNLFAYGQFRISRQRCFINFVESRIMNMIKTLSLIVTMFVTWSAAFAQKGHHIEFRINGLTGGDAIVAFYHGDSKRAKDTITFNEKGVAVMKGNEKVDNGIYLLVMPDGMSFFEFIIPSDDQEFVFITDTTLNPENQKSVGSKDNEAFIKYHQYSQDLGKRSFELKGQLADSTISEEEKVKLREEMIELGKKATAYRSELRKEYEGTFIAKVWRAAEEVPIPEHLENDTTNARFLYYREHFWDNYDLSDDGFVRTPFFHGRLEYYLTKMYSQIPDTVVKAIDKVTSAFEKGGSSEMFKYAVWWSTKHYEESKIMCMDLVLHHMAKNYYCAGRCFWADSSTVAKMCEHAAKVEKQLCGKIAPDMTLSDTSFMKLYRLSAVDAPVTVLLFWDHECGHCKKEVPKINAMMDSMAAKGVVVYAVYTQGDWEGWKKYLRTNKIKFLNVMDAFNNATYRKDYHIISTPQLYVLDKDKRIRFKQVPADNLGEVINYILQEQEAVLDDSIVKPDGSSN